MIRVKSLQYVEDDWHEIEKCEVRATDAIFVSKRFPDRSTNIQYDKLFTEYLVEVDNVLYYDRDLLLDAVEKEKIWKKLNE